jgi:hypothetical protein
VTAIWKCARIAGTGRADFANCFDKHVEQMEAPSWLETVRAEYQAAWNSKRNRLVSALGFGAYLSDQRNYEI